MSPRIAQHQRPCPSLAIVRDPRILRGSGAAGAYPRDPLVVGLVSGFAATLAYFIFYSLLGRRLAHSRAARAKKLARQVSQENSAETTERSHPPTSKESTMTAPHAPSNASKCNRLLLLTALAVTAVGNLCLGAGSAHADEVRPGLTCDDTFGVFTCNNTTDVDYTVLQTRDCAGGSWTTTDYTTTYDSKGHSSSTPHTVVHSAEPHQSFATVFVPAHNSGSGINGCDYETSHIAYSIQTAPPPAT
jgi:hypothetical protein